MKKILKAVLIVSVIMIAGFCAFLYFMSKNSNVIEKKEREEIEKESGIAELQGDKLFASFDTKTNMKELICEGENANILAHFENDVYQIYNVENSSKIRAQLERMREKKDYTFENPLLAYNPYGTNACGLYIYFEAPEKCRLRYTITCEDERVPDFIRDMSESSITEGKKHEYILSGLVPGMTNYIQTELYSQDGKLLESMIYKMSVPVSAYNNATVIACTYNGDVNNISHGLTFMYGTGNNSVAAYDNSGVLRVEIPLIENNSIGIELEDTGMYIAPTGKMVARISQTGQVTSIYDTGKYTIVSQLVQNGIGQLLAVADDDTAKTKGDKIISLDVADGTVNMQVDLKKLLSKYYKKYKKLGKADWLSVSGMEFFDNRDIIISADKARAIIKINNAMSKNPSVDYVLGSPSVWNKKGLSKYLLYKGVPEESETGDEETNALQTYFDEIQNPLGVCTYIVANTENQADETGATEPVDNYYISYIDRDNQAHYKRVNISESTRTAILRNNFETGADMTKGSFSKNINYIIASDARGIVNEFSENGENLMTFTLPVNKAEKHSLEGYWYKKKKILVKE